MMTTTRRKRALLAEKRTASSARSRKREAVAVRAIVEPESLAMTYWRNRLDNDKDGKARPTCRLQVRRSRLPSRIADRSGHVWQ